MELCHILKKHGFAKGKVVVDIQHKKHGIWVASRVAERLTILGNQEILGNCQSLVEIIPSGQPLFQK